MQYAHTQKGALHLILSGIAAMLILSAWLTFDEPRLAIILAVTGCVMVVFAFSFRSLTVFDDGERLAIRYGPIPLFRKSIAYADITSVEAGRSSVVDGWGIHYFPGRGWTYNLWGFGCAVVHREQAVLRIGSDDVENLVRFLKRRIQSKDD